MIFVLFIALAFLISLILGVYIIPRVVLIAKSKRLFDKPSGRKVHQEVVPRLGGLAFFPVAMIAAGFSLGLFFYMGYSLSFIQQKMFIVEFMFFFVSLFAIFFVGLADDIIGIGYRTKFLVQILCALLLLFAGVVVTNFEGLFGVFELTKFLGAPFTVLLVVFAINAFNLIDGVDGLCSGISMVILSMFGGWFIYLSEFVYALVAFAFVGIVLSFFYYNVLGHRLKTFMGDTGSLTLGFVIIFMALKMLALYQGGVTESVHVNSPLSLIAGLLFVPLFDTFRVFALRILKGKSPFEADKTHIHHILLDLGLTHIQSTFTLISATMCYFILNIVLSQFSGLNVNFVFLIDIFIALITYILMDRGVKLRKQRVAERVN